MNKRILSIAVLSILLSCVLLFSGITPLSVSAYSTFQKVEYISGYVTATQLNVRSGPDSSKPIIAVLNKNKWVNILAKIGEWYAIYDPETGIVGCVHGNFIGTADDAKAGIPSTQNPPTVTQAPDKTDTVSEDEQKLLDLINAERAKAGISPLKSDADLMKVARDKAMDMVNNNYFSHNSPTYGSPFDMMRAYGVSFNTAGENIAGNSTIEGAVKAWMNSDGHRKNILNSAYNYTGIGMVKSPKYGYVFVQQFIGK